jgi:hypothetical protein
VQKLKNQKPEILRKKKIIHRKRRSKTPERTALNYSLISRTVIKDLNKAKEKLALQTLRNDDFLVKCNEIQSVCEMLLIRSNKRKSLHIFNKAAKIISSRRNSNTQPLEESEKMQLLQKQDEQPEQVPTKDTVALDSQVVMNIIAPPLIPEEKSQNLIVIEQNWENRSPQHAPSETDETPIYINENWTKDEFLLQKKTTSLQPTSPVLELSPKPFSRAISPKLDFSRTNFSLMKKRENSQSASIVEVAQVTDENLNLEACNDEPLPDIAKLKIKDSELMK